MAIGDQRLSETTVENAARIRQVLATPITSDDVLNPQQELARVLSTVGLTTTSGGGSVTFTGKDPILKSPWPLATMGGVALMAKAVAVADFWRYRTGQGQDLALDLRQVPHRLCLFYDQKWELLNGYPPGAPADPTNPFMPTFMYPTKDGRWIQLLNTYPKAKTRALAFLNCADNYDAIAAVTRTRNAFELEEQANQHGLQAPPSSAAPRNSWNWTSTRTWPRCPWSRSRRSPTRRRKHCRPTPTRHWMGSGPWALATSSPAPAWVARWPTTAPTC